MSDKPKTKKELLSEIEELRAQLYSIQKSQAESKEAEKTFDMTQFAIDRSAEAIYWIGPDGKFLYANHAANEMLGYSTEELLNMAVFDVCPDIPKEAWPEHWVELKRQGSLNFETVSLTKDGRLVPTEVTANFMEHSGEEYNFAFVRDITERKQVEDIEQAAVGICYVSPEGQFLRLNSKLCEILGYSSEELLKLRFQDITHPDDLEEDVELVKKMLARKIDSYSMEKRYFHKNGSHVWANLTVSLICEPSGEPKYFISVVQDITERKKAEEVLESKSQFIDNVLNTTPSHLYIYDFVKNINIYSNHHLNTMLGYSPEEFQEMGSDVLQRIIHPDDNVQMREIIQKLINAENNMIYEGEYRFKHKSGQWVWVKDRAVVFKRNTDGQVIQILGSSTNITDTKRAEEALHASEEKYRNLVETSQDLIWACDGEGRFTYLNPAWERTHGYKLDEMLGNSFTEFQTPEVAAHEAKVFESHMQGGSSFGHETTHIAKSGETIHLIFNAIFTKDEQGNIIGTHGTAHDITERKKAEQALGEKEKLYQDLVLNTDTGFVVVDDVGRVVEANDPYVRLCGASNLQEILGRSVLEWTAPESVESNKAAVERCTRGGFVQDFETIYLRPEGSRANILINATTQDTASGKRTTAMCRDITERKKAAEALAERMRHAEFIAEIGLALTGGGDLREVLQKCCETIVKTLDTAFACIWTFNEKENMLELQSSAGMYTHIDGKHSRFSMNKPSKITGIAIDRKPHLTNSFIDDPLISDPEWAANKGIIAFAGYPLVMDDRLVGVIATFARKPLTDETIHMLDLVANEIAIGVDNKMATEALSVSEENYRNLFEHANDAIFITDPSTRRFLNVNERAEKHLGYSRSELLNMSIDDIHFPETSEQRRLFFKELSDKGNAIMETYHKRRDGTRAPVEISGRLVDYGGKRVSLAFVRDITERKKAEEEHKNLEAQIQHTQKLESLGVLAGGIAHDFNNLLTGILGNASLMYDEISPASPARENLIEIEKAGKKAAEFTRQMLAYSGKGHFVREVISLNEVVEEMGALLNSSIAKKNSLRFELDDNLPPVEVDIAQIQQVVMNLIMNASEAMEDKGGYISITTGVEECDRECLNGTYMQEDLPEGRYVVLEIQDAGSGMDEETMKKLFDPFFTTKFTGRGLGMAAVLGIIRGHKGAIRVESQPGEGSSFTIFFPVSDRPVSHKHQVAAIDTKWRGSGVILFVDDEESNRKLAKSMLKKIGLTTIVAKDGVEALELFRVRNEEISLVILDLTMPRMDGEETFAELRRIRPDIQVLLCSGYSASDVLERFKGKGLAGFIHKPFMLEDLKAKVRGALES